jgi:hypothetical protein
MTPMASVAFGIGTPMRKDRSRVARKRLEIEARHKRAVEGKRQKVGMLQALVADLSEKKRKTARDEDRLRDLKRRLRAAETQLAAMAP